MELCGSSSLWHFTYEKKKNLQPNNKAWPPMQIKKANTKKNKRKYIKK